MSDRYIRPDWFGQHIFNPFVQFLSRLGVSVYGSHVLAVRGRKSGEWRTVAVNPLEYAGTRYLVSPRGVTEWVRNIRVSGGGELRLGSRRESIRVAELSDSDKPPLLRHYLKRWKFEVGAFFDGVGPDSTDAEILAIAGKHPAFEVLPVH